MRAQTCPPFAGSPPRAIDAIVARMPADRRVACALLATLIGCSRGVDGPAIPSPTTVLVRDGGSVLRAPIRASDGCPATAARSSWGPGTLHGATVSGHETWSREGSPHRVPNGVHVIAGASLRVEPCATVLVGPAQEIVVQDDARLRAIGSPEAPILFDSDGDHPAPGDWVGIEIRARALPGTRFARATIRHAGAAPSQRGEPPAALRSRALAGLEVDGLAVERSAGWGVATLGESGFAHDARDLRITGAEGPGAVYLDDVDQVRTLPTVQFAANAVNEVFVAAHLRTLRSDGTWRSLGANARYRIRKSSRIMVEGADAPRLVIAPGTTIAFEEDAELDVGWSAPGALFADGGDETRRVVFTSVDGSAEPSRWVGVLFGERTDTARSGLRYTRIEGAGARATGDFVTCQRSDGERLEPNGMVFFQGVRAAGLLTQTEFRRGPRAGVAVFVAGDSAVAAEDFTASSRGNIFVLAGVRCAQSAAPTGGRCPPTPRCDGGNSQAPTASTPASASASAAAASASARQR